MTYPQYLVVGRHAESEANRNLTHTDCGLYYSLSGSDPCVPLTPRGFEQGEALGDILSVLFPSSRPISTVFETEYVRVGMTVDAATKKLGYPVTRRCDRRLNKRCYGDFWNLTYHGVQTLHAEEYAKYCAEGDLAYRPPNGENYFDLFARIDDFIDNELRTIEGHTLIITHSVVVLAFLRRFTGLSDADVVRMYEEMTLPNGQFLVFSRQSKDAPWLPCDVASLSGLESCRVASVAKEHVMENSPSGSRDRVARRIAASQPSVLASLVVRSKELRAAQKPVIDLAAGVPDFKPNEDLVRKAEHAVRYGHNSYGDARGVIELRNALAVQFATDSGMQYSGHDEVTITAGASSALTAALLALVNPGESVAFFEPYFEQYLTQVRLVGGRARRIKLKTPRFTFTDDQLAKALDGARVLILNTPHNPTGRVFSKEELERVAHHCRKHDVVVIADETYAPFVFEGDHISIASLEGMRERTITINSVSKALNVSGWRIGGVFAPADLTNAIRRVNDLALGAPVPLQEACARFMPEFTLTVADMVGQLRYERNRLCVALLSAGITPIVPEGTMSMLADVSALKKGSDTQVCDWLLTEFGILAAPASAFFHRGANTRFVRFSFARSETVIDAACEALRRVSARL